MKMERIRVNFNCLFIIFIIGIASLFIYAHGNVVFGIDGKRKTIAEAALHTHTFKLSNLKF